MAFSFGGGPPAASTAPSGFNFGTNQATPAAASGFNFSTGSSTTPSLFSNLPAASGASGISFGNATTTPPGGGFGSFGLNTHAQLPTLPSPPVGPPITLETTFEALPDNVQKNMTAFHAFLKEQDHLDAFLKTVSPRQMEVLREKMTQLEQEVLTRRNRQDRQTSAVQQMRQNVRQLLHQVDAATLSRRSLDTSNIHGAPNMYHVMRRVEMPSPYYWELLDHYEQKMTAIKAQIEDVEAQLKPLDNRQRNDVQASDVPVPAQLQHILLAQNTALMQAAARVAEVHEKAEEMRQLFLVKMQEDLARRGEKNPAAFQNPFDKRKKSSEVDKRQAIDKVRFRTSVAPTIVTQQPVVAAPAATPSAFGFGFGSTPAAATPASASGFSFGGLSAPPKSVAFSLASGTSSSMAPLATTTSITAAPFPASSIAAAPAASGGFTAPTVATSNFGSFTSSFLPPSSTDGKASVGSKRRAQKKR